jgi:dTDP-glucose 4,6-dehydratase/UDP-glucose 4-epimerase
LALARNNFPSKYIHLGSRLEYGKANYLPVDEIHATSPKDPYSIEKLLSSVLIERFGYYYNIPYTIIRASNSYGPHIKFEYKNHNLINYYIDEALKGRKLVVFGKGNQKRDFIFIDDLINAILLASISKKANGQIYNVGYGKPISFYSFVRLIAYETGVKVKLKRWTKEFARIETGDYYANINKIKIQLGWEPNVSFKEGVRKCLQQNMV